MARTASRRRRFLRRGIVIVVVAGAAVTGVVVVAGMRPDDEAPVAAPVLKTAAVTAGTVTVDQSIDGSVVLSSTTTVRHRIEGQLAESSASSPANPASSAGGAVTPSTTPTRTEAVTATCVSTPVTVPDTTTATTVPDTTTSTSTTTTTTTQVPATSEPATSEPATSEPATSEPATSEPATSAPDTTVTTTTTPCITDTTVPDTSAPDTGIPEVSVPSGPTAARGGGGGSTPVNRTSAGSGGSATTRVTQKVTSTIATGTSVIAGDVLYTVDGRPVVLLTGVLPAWRTMSADVDDGSDIQQLEASLVALGYDPTGSVTIDGHWDDATTDLVDAWQSGLGQPATGEVTLGSVVFLPTSATVSSVTAAVGDEVGEGDEVLTLAAPTQQVVIDVPDTIQSVVVAGLRVNLGDTTGVVSQVHTVDRDGTVVVQAVITPDAVLPDLTNGSTITVGISVGAATDDAGGSLIVPVEALASRLDGTYAVEVQHADGTTSWVPVTKLAVHGVTVAIRSDGLAAGDEVLLPV